MDTQDKPFNSTDQTGRRSIFVLRGNLLYSQKIKKLRGKLLHQFYFDATTTIESEVITCNYLLAATCQ